MSACVWRELLIYHDHLSESAENSLGTFLRRGPNLKPLGSAYAFLHVYTCECVKVARSERSPCSLEFITLARFHSRLILWLGTYTIMSVYVLLTYKNYAFTINLKSELWLQLHMVVD